MPARCPFGLGTGASLHKAAEVETQRKTNIEEHSKSIQTGQ